MSARLEAALALKDYGLSPFPIPGEVKAPPIEGWQQWAAEADEAKVRTHWEKNPQDNIGIHCGGLLILDVDVPKPNKPKSENDKPKDGPESLAALEAVYGKLPETSRVRTPTGGLHYYFELPAGHPGVSNSASKLGGGLDVRSTGGYVVAPGSRTADGEYVLEHKAGIAPVPQWLLNLCSEARERKNSGAPVSDAEADTLKRAADWLSRHAPAIQGSGGDNHTYVTACKLRDLGLSKQQTFDLMFGEWNSRCAPAWEPADLAVKVHSAFKSAQNAAGVQSISAADFTATAKPASEQSATAEPVTVDPMMPKPAPCEPLSYVDSRAYDASEPRPFVIKGAGAPGTVIEVLGPPGVSKTAALVHTARCIARGKPWFSRATRRSAVVYVASEGRRDVLDRLFGWGKLYGADPSEAPVFVVGRVNFSRDSGRDRLIATMREIERAHGVTVGALMVDTLAASTEGDENDNGVMRDAANRIRDVAEGCNLAAYIAHHPTKTNPRQSRGGGAWLGAIDMQLFVSKNGGVFEMKGGKQRQSGLGKAPMRYTLESATAGIWIDGDPIGVPVVQEADAATAEDFPISEAQAERLTVKGGPIGKAQRGLLKALRTAQAAAGGARVSEHRWRIAYAEQQDISVAGGGNTFRRHRDDLVSAGHVVEEGGLYGARDIQ